MSLSVAVELHRLACEVRALLIRFDGLHEHRGATRLLDHLHGVVADAEALQREHEARVLARYQAAASVRGLTADAPASAA